jgi:hypothetical protein
MRGFAVCDVRALELVVHDCHAVALRVIDFAGLVKTGKWHF